MVKILLFVLTLASMGYKWQLYFCHWSFVMSDHTHGWSDIMVNKHIHINPSGSLLILWSDNLSDHTSLLLTNMIQYLDWQITHGWVLLLPLDNYNHYHKNLIIMHWTNYKYINTTIIHNTSMLEITVNEDLLIHNTCTFNFFKKT